MLQSQPGSHCINTVLSAAAQPLVIFTLGDWGGPLSCTTSLGAAELFIIGASAVCIAPTARLQLFHCRESPKPNKFLHPKRVVHLMVLLPHRVMPRHHKHVPVQGGEQSTGWARPCSQCGTQLTQQSTSSGSPTLPRKPNLHHYETVKFHMVFETSNYSGK